MVEGNGDPEGGGVEGENESGENQEGNVLPNPVQHGSGADGSATVAWGILVPDAATQAAIGMSQAIAGGPPGFTAGLAETIIIGNPRDTAAGGMFAPGSLFSPALAVAAGRMGNLPPPAPSLPGPLARTKLRARGMRGIREKRD